MDLCGLWWEAVLRPLYVAATLQVLGAFKGKGRSKMPLLSKGVPTVKQCQKAYQRETPGGVGEDGVTERLSRDRGPLFYATGR